MSIAGFKTWKKDVGSVVKWKYGKSIKSGFIIFLSWSTC